MVSESGMYEGLQTMALARLRGLPFAKMNGIGNAILIVDARGTDLAVTSEEARALAATPGFAFDQLMVLQDPQPSAADDAADVAVRIFNNDGSEAGACGNGTRCVAWYVRRGDPRDTIVVATRAGLLACRRIGSDRIAVDMGPPAFRWDEIPLRDGTIDPQAIDLGPLGQGFAVSMGNPHVVLFVEVVDTLDLTSLGPPIETSPLFPEHVNVSFAQVLDRGSIRLRVWERGAGATLACGTGACATLVAAAATGRTDRQARIDLPGGSLDLAWTGEDRVVMSGPVALEREGRLGVATDDRAA
jgi:diaminopimelate epimerase